MLGHRMEIALKWTLRTKPLWAGKHSFLDVSKGERVPFECSFYTFCDVFCFSSCFEQLLIDWLIKLGFDVTFSNKIEIHYSHEVARHVFRYTWSNTIGLLFHKNHNKFFYALILHCLWSSLLDSFLHLLTLVSSEFSQLHSLERIRE